MILLTRWHIFEQNLCQNNCNLIRKKLFRMINRTILIHSGDIFNYYETKKGMNALMDPERQSNEALTNNLEFDFDENNSIILNDRQNIIRLRKESDYPQTTCSRYPECHELTLKV